MKSILLIGLGRFGQNVAAKLNELGHEVMAVDCDEERVNDILPIVVDAQIGDSTNSDFIASLGVSNYDVCFVCIAHNFQSSLETTSLLKEMGGRMVVARAESEVQRKFLLRNGADAVVYPEGQMGAWAAIRYSTDNILDYIQLDGQHAIFEVSVPKQWLGKTVAELDVRKKYGINILALKRGGRLTVSVDPETVFTDDITMLVLGEKQVLERCFGA